ncbi:MAG: hypothetical protein U5J82_05295 [Desulfobacterales bacterium]|nr:hypothetical protein [Desulfobacterales bacterium]
MIRCPCIRQTPTGTVIDLEEFKTIGPQTNILGHVEKPGGGGLPGEQEPGPGHRLDLSAGASARPFRHGHRQSDGAEDRGAQVHQHRGLCPAVTLSDQRGGQAARAHSALDHSKSIGGVVNMDFAKAPPPTSSLKPDVALTASYGSYETQNHLATVQGAVENFTYDTAYWRYLTDGYLRHSETDIETLYGRLGYLLPADGFVDTGSSGTDTDGRAGQQPQRPFRGLQIALP